MNELMRQAARMQRRVEELRAKFKEQAFEVKGANDKVTVKINGDRQVLALTVEPAFFKDEDSSLVQDAIVGTLNAAMKELDTRWNAEVEKLTGGAKVPGVL